MQEQKYSIIYIDESVNERPDNFHIQARSIHKDITQKNKPNLKKFAYFFQKWKQYPDVWTWYYQALKKNNRKEEAKECLNELIELFPDYLYGKIALANQYIDEENAEKAREILGSEPDISLIQPNKEEFFYEDILKYYATYVRMELLLDNIEAAKLILEKAKTEIKKQNKIVDIIEKQLHAYNISIFSKRMNEFKSLERVPTFIDKNNYENYSPTEFQHAEIQSIYDDSFMRTKEEIDRILSLPRESVIRDLEEIIRRTIYEKEESLDGIGYNAVISSIFFLTELKAIESKDIIFQLLRQNNDYIDYWFGDFHTEILTPLLYQLALIYPEELKEYAKEPNINTFFKTLVFDAQAMVLGFHPEKRTFVLNWFKELLDFYYQEKENENILDTVLLGMIESTILDLKFKELLPILEKLHEEQLVDEMSCGEIDDVRKEFEIEYPPKELEEFDIYTMFEKFIGGPKTINNNDRENYSKYFSDKNENTSIRSGKKIGRNDPCPCGSGKKYKKCCGS